MKVRTRREFFRGLLDLACEVAVPRVGRKAGVDDPAEALRAFQAGDEPHPPAPATRDDAGAS